MGEQGETFSSDVIDQLPIPRESLGHRRSTLIGALMKMESVEHHGQLKKEPKIETVKIDNVLVDVYSEEWARHYRCCCKLLSLRKSCALIGAVDLIIYCAIFARGVHLFLNIRSNPAATAWFVASTMLLSLEMFAILCLWIGLVINKPLWILPKIVMKLFELLFVIAGISALGYMIYMGSELVLDLIITNLDLKYKAALSTMKLGGLLMIAGGIIIACLQCWFMFTLFDSYRFIREVDIQRYRRLKLRSLEDDIGNGLGSRYDYNELIQNSRAGSKSSSAHSHITQQGHYERKSSLKGGHKLSVGKTNNAETELLTVLSSPNNNNPPDITIFMTTLDGPQSTWNSTV